MPSRFAWLYNNEQDSDVSIVIAVEGTSTRPPKKKRRVAKNSSQTITSDHSATKLNGHAVILASTSEFFRARCSSRWNGNATSTSRSSGNVVYEVRLEMRSEVQVLAARRMVEYIYREELDSDLSAQDVLQVMQVADMFGVEVAIDGCIDHLASMDVNNFTEDDLQQVMALPTVLHTIDTKQQFKKLASRVINRVVADLVNLEAAWQDENLRQKFLNLPVIALVHYLKKDRLKVLSENVVLLATVSWLRSPIGSAATDEERKAVFILIRLPQLTTSYRNMLFIHMMEVADLLPDIYLDKLVPEFVAGGWQYCCPDNSPSHWLITRDVPEERTRTLKLKLKEADVVRGIKEFRKHQKPVTIKWPSDQPVIFDGFQVEPYMRIQRSEQQYVDGATACILTVGIDVDVVVNGEATYREIEYCRPGLAKVRFCGKAVCDHSEVWHEDDVGSTCCVIKDCRKPLAELRRLEVNGGWKVKFVLSNPSEM